MLVFIFKTHDYGGVGSNRLDYIPLTRKLISILYSYTLSHVDTCASVCSICVQNKLQFYLIWRLVLPFLFHVQNQLCPLVFYFCLYHTCCNVLVSVTHGDTSYRGGQMDWKFLSQNLFCKPQGGGSSLFRSGCLPHPLRHFQLISQELVLVSFSFHLACDIISSTEDFTLFFFF